MSMPLAWVERIFHKLSVAYGRDFLGKYEGMPLADVKTDWAHELSNCTGDSVRHALENLTSKAPNVYEFRALCAASPKMIGLPAPLPKQDPLIVRKIIEGIKPVEKQDPRAWAHKIIKKHADGAKVTPTVLLFARQALGEAA